MCVLRRPTVCCIYVKLDREDRGGGAAQKLAALPYAALSIPRVKILFDSKVCYRRSAIGTAAEEAGGGPAFQGFPSDRRARRSARTHRRAAAVVDFFIDNRDSVTSHRESRTVFTAVLFREPSSARFFSGGINRSSLNSLPPRPLFTSASSGIAISFFRGASFLLVSSARALKRIASRRFIKTANVDIHLYRMQKKNTILRRIVAYTAVGWKLRLH